MRARVVGRALAALGGVAVAVAFLLPLAAPASVEQSPLDDAYRSTAVGADVTFLDPVTLVQRSGEEVEVSLRVRPGTDAYAAGPRTAVREYTATTRAADGTLLGTTSTTACLDRRTAEAVDCPAETVDGRPADVRGLVEGFPPATPQQDRMLWDGTVQASFPVRYLGSERFRGLAVQRFEHVVPEQVVRSVTVPGALVGADEPDAPAEVVYGTTRSLLVEPVSGVVVSVEEIPLTRLRAADGSPGAVLLGGAFRSSEDSVDDAVARATEVRDRRAAIAADVLPWVVGSAGVVLLGLGAVLVARSGAASVATPDEAVRRPVPVA